MPPAGQSTRAPGAKTYWPDGWAATLRRCWTDSKEPWPLCQASSTTGCLAGRCLQARRQRSIRLMEFSRELREDVMSGDITVSFRLWRRPKVREGGQYPVGPVKIEVDSVELVPFASITAADIRRSGERDRESLRQRAAHAGPIADGTLLYRVEFHLVESQAR